MIDFPREPDVDHNGFNATRRPLAVTLLLPRALTSPFRGEAIRTTDLGEAFAQYPAIDRNGAIALAAKARNKLQRFALTRGTMICAAPGGKFIFSKTAVPATESREMAKPKEEQIRVRAHELCERAGRPEGREDEFWRQAEKELAGGATADEKSQTFLECFCDRGPP
jgi:Protein of unknown function (DUF2934)